MVNESQSRVASLSIFGVGVAAGTVMGALMAAKPVQAATTEEKMDYLIKVNEAMVALLEQLHKDSLDTIAALQALAQALGGAPGIEVSVLTPWRAREPIELYRQEVRAAGTIFTDSMVNWTQGKRLVIKVESSLNQPVQVQIIGNIVDTRDLATDINGPLPCAANGNISVGLAWDDWHPYIGARISVPVAPTAGILTVWAVIQE